MLVPRRAGRDEIVPLGIGEPALYAGEWQVGVAGRGKAEILAENRRHFRINPGGIPRGCVMGVGEMMLASQRVLARDTLQICQYSPRLW